MGSTFRRSLEFDSKIQSLRYELAVIINVRTGKAHPDYPATMLHFHLLNGELFFWLDAPTPLPPLETQERGKLTCQHRITAQLHGRVL